MAERAVDIDAVRHVFADAMMKSGYIPNTAEIVIRPGAIPEATAIHCDWPLIEKGPYSGNRSREITVKINAAAMKLFRSAEARERAAMLDRFIHIFQVRLLEDGYNEQDPSPPPFIVSIDEHSLER
jgi:hypothetical protein